MRNYKSLILAGLLAFGFSSCNTDDLEKDIDDLANRVADFEAQVLKLNDEMNIIRVLMDGNKTITKYTVEGNKYVLTLSNGETITLTQGNDGVTYPKVEIIGGNWYVDGSDTGIKAKAEDGIDTPQPPVFKIENGNWHVSYDGGKTYEDLKVSATETGTQGESPISDFKLDGNKFVFTIGSNIYEIPVIEDLTCQIAEESDMVTIAQGASREVKINVNLKAGDLVRAIAPVEWKAVVSDYSALTGEQELTVSVTAPSVVSKGVLTVEVTRGVNTITDEIVLKTGVTSYYDEYMAGMDIQIGNITINKFTHPNVTLVDASSSSKNISSAGVYFIASDLEDVTCNTSSAVDKLILISDSPNEKATVKFTTSAKLGSESESPVFIMYGLKVDFTNLTTVDPMALSGSQPFKFYVDWCELTSGARSFVQIKSGENFNFEEFVIKNTEIKYFVNEASADISGKHLININNNAVTKTFGKIVMENNLIYNALTNYRVIQFCVLSALNVVPSSVYFVNNTLINMQSAYANSSRGLFYCDHVDNVVLKNNILWYNQNMANNGYSIIHPKAKHEGTFDVGNNIAYSKNATSDKDGDVGINLFYGQFAPDGAEQIVRLPESPLEITDISNGIYKITNEDYSANGYQKK